MERDKRTLTKVVCMGLPALAQAILPAVPAGALGQDNPPESTHETQGPQGRSTMGRIDLSPLQFEPDGRYRGNLQEACNHLLEKNRGILIGETHGERALLLAIKEALPDLKKRGVTTLFVEILSTADQQLLDQAMLTGNFDAIKVRLDRGFINMTGTVEDYVNILKGARSLNISVKGIDHPQGLDVPHEKRNLYMSVPVNEFIKNHPDQKFLVFCGAGHALTSRGIGTETGIPTLCQRSTDANEDVVKLGDGILDDILLEFKDNKRLDGSTTREKK